MMLDTYLAIDFGAGSGRVMAGFVSAGMVDLEEIYRFPNRQVKLGNHLYWDFPALFADMKQGISKAVRRGYHIKGIGIDTWGVDFGLIDKKGNLLSTLFVIVIPGQMDFLKNSLQVRMFHSIMPKQVFR